VRGDALQVLVRCPEERFVLLDPPQVQVQVVLPGDRDPSVHLDRVTDHVHRVLGGRRLRGRGRNLRVPPTDRPGPEVGRGAGVLDRDEHVGEHVLHRLERADRRVELAADLRVLRAQLECARGGARGVGGEQHRGTVGRVDEDPSRGARRADGLEGCTLEHELGGSAGAVETRQVADLDSGLPAPDHREARAGRIDEGHERDVGLGRFGDERDPADEAVRSRDGRGSEPGEGSEGGEQSTVGEAGEELGALRGRRERIEDGGGQRGAPQERHRGEGTAELLGDDGLLEDPASASALGRIESEPEGPDLGEASPQRPIDCGATVVRGTRSGVVREHSAEGEAQLLLLGVEAVLHVVGLQTIRPGQSACESRRACAVVQSLRVGELRGGAATTSRAGRGGRPGPTRRYREVDGPVTEFDTLRVERDGAVTIVTIDRPERLNAINGAMMVELERFWDGFDADPDQRVAVVTGAGVRAFCVGADVKEIAELGELPERQRHPDVRIASRITPLQARVSKPAICAVNGICAGGGLHFVADCDVTIAAEEATFIDPHVSVGQVSALEPVVLARRMPLGALLRMVLVGSHETMTAERAYELGIVTEVVPRANLLDAALVLAQRIAANSPAAVAASRRAIWDSLELPLEGARQHGWDLLRRHWAHPDFEEGPRAFAERREPRWRPG
jgi:enoyl-CoA hydratase/carnithine racemase